MGVKDLQFQSRSLLTTSLWGSSTPDWWKTHNVSYLHPWRLGKFRGWQFKWPKSLSWSLLIFSGENVHFSVLPCPLKLSCMVEEQDGDGIILTAWQRLLLASSGVACGFSTELFCYFHNLVISKLPKVGAGRGELSVTALGFSSIEVFVLELLFTGPLLLAVSFSLKCSLSALPLQMHFVEKVAENQIKASWPQPQLSCMGRPFRKLFLCYFQSSFQIPRSLAKTSRQPSLE